MDNTLLWYGMGIIAVMVNINLWVTFRLFHVVKYIRIPQEAPKERKIGEMTPAFSATRLNDNVGIETGQFPQYSKVLIYLSTECTKCKSKLPELSKLIANVGDAGVMIWLVSMEPKRRIKDFFSNPLLMQSAVLIEDSIYKQLNPLGASPFYQFIDNNGILQAQGMIGDANWEGFRNQLEQANQ